MSEIEKTCVNCQYDLEDIDGTHCRHCIHSAEEHFKPKEMYTEEQKIRNKVIDEFVKRIKKYQFHSNERFENCVAVSNIDWLVEVMKEGDK